MAAQRRSPTDGWPLSPTAAISWPNRARRSHRSTGFRMGWATWRRSRTDACWRRCSAVNPPTGAPGYWRSWIRPTTGWCRSMSRPTPPSIRPFSSGRSHGRRCCPTRSAIPASACPAPQDSSTLKTCASPERRMPIGTRSVPSACCARGVSACGRPTGISCTREKR